MGHKGVLGLIGRLRRPHPGEIVIVAALGESVIAHGQNLVILAYDAGANLGTGILGPHPGKQRHAHEIFIPADVILSFA